MLRSTLLRLSQCGIRRTAAINASRVRSPNIIRLSVIERHIAGGTQACVNIQQVRSMATTGDEANAKGTGAGAVEETPKQEVKFLG